MPLPLFFASFGPHVKRIGILKAIYPGLVAAAVSGRGGLRR
ncbi:hypothetical protein [Bradyrhizobium sp.]|nr:hypothetical protein [Bradyrhizobium sp.]